MSAPVTTRAESAWPFRWVAWLLQPPPPRSSWLRPALVAYSLILILGEYLENDSDVGAGMVSAVRIVLLAALYSPLLAYAVGVRLGVLTTALVTIGSGVLVQQGVQAVPAGVTFTIVLLVVAQTVWMVTACLQTREAFWWMGLVVAALVGHSMLQPQAIPRSLMVAMPLVLLPAVAGLVMAAYRRRARRATEEAVALEERLDRTRQEERDFLSRELHDIVAHDITVIAMQARRARIRNDPETQQEILEGIAESARRALDDLRRMVSVLRGQNSVDSGPRGGAESGSDGHPLSEWGGIITGGGELSADVDRVAAAIDAAGFQVEHQIVGDPARIPKGLVHTLSRAAREMGTNIMRYADPAHPVTLSLEVGQQEVVLHSANGIGHEEPIQGTGNGLVIMGLRAQVLHGRLEMGEVGPGRWATRMSLPLLA